MVVVIVNPHCSCSSNGGNEHTLYARPQQHGRPQESLAVVTWQITRRGVLVMLKLVVSKQRIRKNASGHQCAASCTPSLFLLVVVVEVVMAVVGGCGCRVVLTVSCCVVVQVVGSWQGGE